MIQGKSWDYIDHKLTEITVPVKVYSGMRILCETYDEEEVVAAIMKRTPWDAILDEYYTACEEQQIRKDEVDGDKAFEWFERAVRTKLMSGENFFAWRILVEFDPEQWIDEDDDEDENYCPNNIRDVSVK